MKKLILLYLLVSSLALAEPFKLRNGDLSELASALAALDGTEKQVDQGPGNPPRIIREPYKFSGDVRARMAADLAVISEAEKSVQQQRNALIKQTSGGGNFIDPKHPDQVAAFTVAAQTLFEATVSLELSPIPVSDLQLEQNAIPVSVLAILARLRPKA